MSFYTIEKRFILKEINEYFVQCSIVFNKNRKSQSTPEYTQCIKKKKTRLDCSEGSSTEMVRKNTKKTTKKTEGQR